MYFTPAVLLAYLTLTHLTTAQIVSPFATHDCSKQIVYTGDHACNNDLTKCCGSTGTCCAGGCCPSDAFCVFSGTAKEACCSISDKTGCGSAPPPSTATCPPASAPSVPCSGLGSNWYCHPGCTCDVSTKGGCNCFTGNCIPAGSSPSSSSTKLAASSTSVAPVASKSTTSSSTSTTTSTLTSSPSSKLAESVAASASVASSQTQSSNGGSSSSSVPAAAGTSIQTVQPSVNAQSSTSSSAAATTTRASASEGVKVGLGSLWGLVLNVAAFGGMLLL